MLYLKKYQMPKALSRRTSTFYTVMLKGYLRLLAPDICFQAMNEQTAADVGCDYAKDASRRTNPNNPAFYKPVRKGLVRRLA